MRTRRQMGYVLAVVFSSMGASYRTTNFVVDAPTSQLAEQVGKWAEYYRKQKAEQWIGREMPNWPTPCPVHVRVTMNAGGATKFTFMPGKTDQDMEIEGPVDRLIASVLPHEVTHTVFAYYFGCPVPRWADEGGAVLSEDEVERRRHDALVRQLLGAGRAFPLQRLFSLNKYPQEVGTLYAEGYSVVDFLVSTSDRQTFLRFVAQGMQYGWDQAARSVYGYTDIHKVEEAWINYLRTSHRQPSATLMSRTNAPTSSDLSQHAFVRLTAPPVQPLQESRPAIIRAQAPEPEVRQPAPNSTHQTVVIRQGYLPDYEPAGKPAPATDPRPPVRLGTPQLDWSPPPASRRIPPETSPIGYPY